MKKFEIIEKGVLNQSEMSMTRGGYIKCYPYVNSPSCPGNTKNYSVCGGFYTSCNGITYFSCKTGIYKGAPGSGGIILSSDLSKL